MSTEPDQLDEVELEGQEGELLPEREEMSVLDLGEGGGLAPPPFDTDPWEPVEETPSTTPDQPPQ